MLPIAIRGTGRALPRGSWVMHPATAVARVLTPVQTTGLTLRDVPALREQVRDMIAAACVALGAEADGRSVAQAPGPL